MKEKEAITKEKEDLYKQLLAETINSSNLKDQLATAKSDSKEHERLLLLEENMLNVRGAHEFIRWHVEVRISVFDV